VRSHQELKELLGAYALNALDNDERRDMDAHLSACRSCSEELGEHLETLATLTQDDDDVPAGVWHRIAGSLEEVPPVQMLMAKPARRWVPTRLGFALGAAAIIVFAIMGTRLVQQERRLDSFATAISSKSLHRLAEAAESDPRAVLLSLQSPDKATFARVVVLPDGSAYLTADNLEQLPPEKTYQLWALRGDERISLGVLGTDPKVSAFRTVTGVSGFAITVESAGGVPITTNNPVVFGFTEG
jgi:anti-sigma-K factor RskA